MNNLKIFVILCVIMVISSTSANPHPEGEKGESITKPKEIGEECLCANTMELLPVCASNGRTYPNKGAVRCENKCKRLHLRILHPGECGKNSYYETK